MYLYIYDQCVQDKKYEREMAAVESRLTDLGINGKVVRLALFRHAADQIREEARRGGSTVVVVGNDQTVRQVLDVVVETGLPLGIIPVGPNNQLAALLGIPSGSAACDVLSARMITSVDAGVVNGKRFLLSVTFPQPEAVVTCDDQYRISMSPLGQMEVRNMAIGSDPLDGVLDVRVVVPQPSGFFRKRHSASRLPVHHLLMDALAPVEAFCDGESVKTNHFAIHLEPLAVKLITGKGRKF